MLRVALVVVTTAVVAFAASCKKEEEAAPSGKPAKATEQPELRPPPPGTDADKKLTAALELAKTIDDSLGTLTKSEPALKPGADGKQRKAALWASGKSPKKLAVTIVDDKGAATAATDIYYDANGKIGFVRAPDGLFVFNNESLALWLDENKIVKRGVTPQEARMRVEEINGDSKAALVGAGIQ